MAINGHYGHKKIQLSVFDVAIFMAVEGRKKLLSPSKLIFDCLKMVNIGDLGLAFTQFIPKDYWKASLEALGKSLLYSNKLNAGETLAGGGQANYFRERLENVYSAMSAADKQVYLPGFEKHMYPLKEETL